MKSNQTPLLPHSTQYQHCPGKTGLGGTGAREPQDDKGVEGSQGNWPLVPCSTPYRNCPGNTGLVGQGYGSLKMTKV